MLDSKRVKEAEGNVRNYLSEGLLKKVEKVDKNILNTYKKNCEESLETANFLDKNNRPPLWIIVCSYYSMYYMANAVLYNIGYKVGERISHKVTSDALIVFIRGKLRKKLLEEFEEAREEASEIVGLKANGIIKSFDFERVKRSKFQYNMTEKVKKSKSITSLDRAKDFVFELEKLLV
ncbi:MAG: hypothetical protein ISS48_04560 [Candidatus Aenigmarchaeota archaeon]|nr:hypothetical protein [Candidatus Aenigmarchaeota archaeon]